MPLQRVNTRNTGTNNPPKHKAELVRYRLTHFPGIPLMQQSGSLWLMVFFVFFFNIFFCLLFFLGFGSRTGNRWSCLPPAVHATIRSQNPGKKKAVLVIISDVLNVFRGIFMSSFDSEGKVLTGNERTIVFVMLRHLFVFCIFDEKWSKWVVFFFL